MIYRARMACRESYIYCAANVSLRICGIGGGQRPRQLRTMAWVCTKVRGLSL